MHPVTKTLLLMALGAGVVLAAQSYLAGGIRSQGSAEPVRPQSSGRAPRYMDYAPEPRQEKISARFASIADEARAHIARTGQALTNFYYGGNSVTPVDADENDRSRYSGDLGNIVYEATHE